MLTKVLQYFERAFRRNHPALHNVASAFGLCNVQGVGCTPNESATREVQLW